MLDRIKSALGITSSVFNEEIEASADYLIFIAAGYSGRKIVITN